ncbi:acyl-CoA dehydrogenase family protein [Frankia sp. Cas3]|uniref:acyl-CoA dehydrogenase family protein n=1 Tax=Frankia sp. Cas3 TaxID=3073926 RepID=UPI002AD3B5EB|nr:acyl-CoA dehydrogenase family protein [Frankia sp. Cas3]
MMDADELALVRSSLCRVLRGTEAAALPTALLESGWADLVDPGLEHDADPDIDPGAGAGAGSRTSAAAVLAVLAEESGRGLVPGPALDLAVLHALGLPADDVTAVVLPPLPARGPAAAVAGVRFDGGLVVDGFVLAGAGRAKRLLVATDGGVVAVDPTSASVSVVPVGGLDPDLGLLAVRGTVAAGGCSVVAGGPRVAAATAMARRFLAGQLVGIAAAMLEATVTYVIQREQYGRPIGSFQAVKHRLADVHVARCAAEDAVAFAWEDGGELAAVAAKALAGRAFLTAATHCQQVHGAIAFTVEHELHRYVRRGYVLDTLFGSADDLTWELGERLLASGTVPRLPPL